MERKYIPELDGLRGIAAILVLMAHYEIIHFGWIALPMFFILSGYLISSILLRQKETPGSILEKFRTFWVRRALRIFPLYYLYLLILGITFVLIGYPADFDKHVAYLGSYTYNWFVLYRDGYMSSLEGVAHLWTLSVEEQFYLVLPFLIFTLGLRSLKWLTIFIIILVIPFRYFLAEYYLNTDKNTEILLHTNLVWYLDAFFIGVAINIFNTPAWKNKQLYLYLLFFALVICGVLNFLTNGQTITWYTYFQTIGYPFLNFNNYQHVWSYTLWNLFSGILMTVLIADSGNSRSYLSKIFSLRFFRTTGKLSYGIYIYHYCLLDLFFWIFNVAHPFKLEDWPLLFACFLSYIIGVYSLSWLSYTYFEKRFVRLSPKYK